MMKILLFMLTAASTGVRAQDYAAMREAFLEQRGAVREMKLEHVGESGLTTTFDFFLRSTTGDSLSGRLRLPKGEGPFPAALLCVGIETGKQVIEMIEGQDSVALVAADYPFEGELDFSGWNAVGTATRLRSMAMRTIPLLLNCLDWLVHHPGIDRNDVTVVSVSFGIFTGLPVGVIDQRVKQVVVVQGGGDLGAVIARNAERLDVPIPSWLAGWIGGAIFGPFEPNMYVPHLAPRSLLMLNSEGDTFFPKESALSLFENARHPKEIVWHRSRHLMPGEQELIRELTNLVVKKLY